MQSLEEQNGGVQNRDVRRSEGANGTQASARATDHASAQPPAHGWAPTANWPVTWEQIKLGILAQIQHDAAKGGPNELKPPSELHDFHKRSDLVFYDENHNPVKVAYAIVPWS